MSTSAGGRLDVFGGSPRCIFSHTDHTASPKVSSLRSRQKALSGQGFTIRSEVCTTSLYQMHGTGGSYPTQEAVVRLPLLGRLAAERAISSPSKQGFPSLSGPSKQTRPSCKYAKVSASPNAGNPIFGCHSGHKQGKSVSFGGETFFDATEVRISSSGHASDSPASSISAGVDGVVYISHPMSQAENEAVTTELGVQLEPSFWPMGRSDSAVSSSKIVHCVVDQANEPFERGSFPPTSPISIPSNRCLSVGMGGAHGLPPDSRQVVGQGAAVSHKHVRAQSSPSCSQSFSPLNRSLISSGANRQHDHNVLSKQARGNALSAALPGSTTDLALASGSRPLHHGGASARRAERAGRRTQSALRRSARLGAKRRGGGGNFQAMGLPFHRSVCRRPKHKMLRLHVQVPPARDAGECTFDGLVRNICLRFSSPASDTEGGVQAHPLQHDDDLDSSGLATAMVVPGPSAAVSAPPQETPMQAGPSNQAEREDPPSEPSLVELGGMAPEVLQYGHLNLPQDCMYILKEAKRPSTRASYAFKWKRFYLWCARNHFDPTKGQAEVILPYLLHLARAGLKYSSIRVHLAAITAYRKSPAQPSFFQMQVVKGFLQGLKKVYPPVRPPSPPWELNLVLSRLMAPPFEPIHKATLPHLSWKTAFLVAITSARRISEIQALCTKQPYTVFHHNRVVLRTHPSFLPKVVSDFHINQTISLPSFFPNPSSPAERSLHSLDLKRILKFYLDKTKGLRKSDQLFVNYGAMRTGYPASKRSIARWIVSCIKMAYQLANRPLLLSPKAHSTRGKAATVAFLQDVPLSEICKAATWSSVHTFTQHYCLESDSRADTQVGQASLRNLFQ